MENWTQPKSNENSFITGQKLNNTLTSEKLVDFIPHDGRNVSWYTCGPTVYSQSHLGHAKAYVSGDMIRRILKDYFGYNVYQVMNITDIDDKIIIESNNLSEDFDKFAKKNEAQFWEDMGSLGIVFPDEIVRVSEFIPEIVEYIDGIIKNGFAYESNGSVYFDISAYTKDGKFVYGKLDASAVDDENLMKEGEGQLSNTTASEKRNKKDFALWKASKPNEPKWPSPWGEGRPGWHVECSAMCHYAMKTFPVDIHSGGIDLKFPHHENELAQSEAYYNKCQWVNYFVHYGHLHINGAKMGRSLKNFTTIKELLKLKTARAVRLFFATHQYDAEINYEFDTAWEHIVTKDKFINEWFLSMAASTRKGYNVNASQKFDAVDRTLNDDFLEKKKKIHEHMCRNFATPGVVNELHDLMNSVNTYLKKPESEHKFPMLRNIHTYVDHVLTCLGLEYGKDSGKDGAKTVGPLMDIFAGYRDQVRKAAKNKDIDEVQKVSDRVRDTDLPELGIRLEDAGDKASIWKFQSKEEIMADRQAKEKAAAEKAKKKEEEKLKREKKEDEEGRVNPREMFFKNKDFSKFDEQGLPTHNANGDELAKKSRTKNEGIWNRQEQKYQKWLAKQIPAEEMKTETAPKVE